MRGTTAPLPLPLLCCAVAFTEDCVRRRMEESKSEEG